MLKHYDLQLLAESTPEQEGDEPNAQTAGANHGPDEGSRSTPKTYTQEEVDHLVGLQKAKLPSKDDWAAFKAWQFTQQQKKSAPDHRSGD